MNVLSWNYRGLGNLYASVVLSHLVRQKAPKVLFLMETKQTMDKMKKIQTELRYDNMLVVPCIYRASSLAMLWNEEITYIFRLTLKIINAHIMTGTTNPWRLTIFYGRLEEHHRHESWNYLRHLHTQDSLPWVCLGDFNEILNSTEKQGRLPKPH